MNDVVVVVPVLGRPANAAPLVESWEAARRAGGATQRLLFVATPGDDAQIAACHRACRASFHAATAVAPFPREPGDFARKINFAYQTTREPWLFQAADDVDFTGGWADEAIRVGLAAGAGVVGTNDDANPTVKRGLASTHSLILRAYIDADGASLDGPGVVFHEGYGHQFVDAELVQLAVSRGRFAFAKTAVVRHRHPIWRTAVQDDTYRLALSTSQADSDLYRRRSRSWR